MKLLEIIPGENQLYLVFEYFNTDLKKYISNLGRPLSIEEAKHILWQILLALEHCYTKRIMHRDLKPCDVLIGEDE